MVPNDKLGSPVFWTCFTILCVSVIFADKIPLLDPRPTSFLAGLVIAGVTLGLLLIVGWAAWLFRMYCRSWYGLLEICVAVWAIYSTIVVDSNGIQTIVGLFAAIYIVVRGLDNLDEGHKHRDVNHRWRKIWVRIRLQDYKVEPGHACGKSDASNAG